MISGKRRPDHRDYRIVNCVVLCKVNREPANNDVYTTASCLCEVLSDQNVGKVTVRNGVEKFKLRATKIPGLEQDV
jgi:hypothetical protein